MEEETISKILEGDNSHDNLCKYFLGANINDVKGLIKSYTRKSDGPRVIREASLSLNRENYLPRTETLRLEIALLLISEVAKNSSIPNTNAAKYLDCIELDTFSDQSLGHLHHKCRQLVDSDCDSSFRWLPVLGRLFSAVQSRELFKPNDDGDEDSGTNFVEMYIRDICELEWNLDMVTGMCSILKVITF